MEIRWDIFATLVALAGFPFMVNPTTIHLLRRLYLVFARFVWSERHFCEVLTWEDIPSGFLHQCPNQLCNCANFGQAVHDPENPPKSHEECFKSTVGKVFPRAWASPSRREKRVNKPVQLDIQRPYIRTCRTTLRAYALLAQPMGLEDDIGSVISFKNVGSILTAHLHAGDDTFGWAYGELGLTKAEVECILQGYPPFYRSQLKLPNGEYVRSPIKSKEDINLGGWIAGVGISVTGSRPTHRHNMALTSAYHGGRLWPHTVMGNAVRRVGERFRDFAEHFPDDKAVRLANELFKYMIMDNSHLTCYSRYCSDWNDRGYFDDHHVTTINKLTASEWESVLLLYNRRTPFSTKETDLFAKHSKTIVHAALNGLRNVLNYGENASHVVIHPVTKLPPMPELNGISDRQIYLLSCFGNA
jgi:hypothetical protein